MTAARTRVVGYTRVSTDEQAREGTSIKAQPAKIRAYCDLHDLDLVETYEDPGVSAKDLDRPGLQRALDALTSGRATGLCVTKLDRLTRDVGDWSTLIDRFFGERAGYALLSVSDSVDTRTASGRMVLNMLMTVAQWEREVIAERTRDALRHLKARGKQLGGSRPGSYRIHTEAQRRGLAASRAARTRAAAEARRGVLPLARELRSTLSLRGVARRLNALGYRTRTGKPWGPVQVSRLLGHAPAEPADLLEPGDPSPVP